MMKNTERMKMEGRNKLLIIILIVMAICIFLSQNFGSLGDTTLDFFDWTSYYVDPTMWHVSFQDSFMGKMLGATFGYWPSIVGGVTLLGTFLIFANIRAAGIACKVAGILAIIGFFIYILPSLILQIVGSIIPFPNQPGAYFYIVPGIMVLILSFLLKKPKPMGYAKEDKDYYAIDTGPVASVSPDMQGPKTECPHCGALVPADQQFCEMCGEYF